MRLDLNCDLGEGEPLAHTRALLRWVTSANVACGGHAGSADSMRTSVRLAKQFGVHLGAHPGPWSRSDRGRGSVELTAEELELLLLHQVGAFERICRSEGVPPHHLKLHGALYHLTETDRSLGKQYVRAVQRWWPKTILYVQAGGSVAKTARQAGLQVWDEAFADRGYLADGSLIPRGQTGALLTEVPLVVARLKTLLRQRHILAVDGTPVRIHPRTLCLHSDSPNARALARAVSAILQRTNRSQVLP